ncbi:hypothetical protein BDV29DRAFT_154697 [Aspergillus leporis]|uniref:Uncharacterized protein n=1 Tax=Aspergillus leporis TaxID=41062 RepID=A0A5N5X6K3_9EURO|nr:hypothetical protein BDV29DRAFT_154697 [Aspergillus leporis]
MERERLCTQLLVNIEEYKQWLETLSTVIKADTSGSMAEVERFLEARTAPRGKQASAAAASKAPETAECTACTDRVRLPETLQTPCLHRYCRSCLGKMIGDSLKDLSLFPPRCCRAEIPLDLLRPYLDLTIIRKFETRAVEINDRNRLYCYNVQCASYLPPSDRRDNVALCTNCWRETCALCPSHGWFKRVHQLGYQDEMEELSELPLYDRTN